VLLLSTGNRTEIKLFLSKIIRLTPLRDSAGLSPAFPEERVNYIGICQERLTLSRRVFIAYQKVCKPQSSNKAFTRLHQP